MKYALVIPDGCADEPQASLGGKTPLEAAQIPHMDEVVRRGVIGRTNNVPASMPSGSDVGTMSLFGYDPFHYHTGRAPLEAAAQGIALGPEDWAIRCNLVTIQDGMMRSFTAGQIPNDIARELMSLLQQDQSANSRWQFYAGVSYRNLLIYRGEGQPPPFGEDTLTVPPHDVTDRHVAEFLPRGSGAELLRGLMRRSEAVFASSPANAARQVPATGIWLWGLGRTPRLPPFAQRFGKTAAVITAVDLLRGLGTLLGWTIVHVPGATGYLDTDYAGKGRAAIAALDEVDLIVVHVEATDEASHEGDADAKVRALERIDRDIVAPLHAHLQSRGEYRLLICPDHPTFLRTKTHSYGDCPLAMCGTGVMPDAAATYDEPTAAASPLVFPRGHELMGWFLG